MNVIKRINNLIDEHNGEYQLCNGCKKCDEIKQLRKFIDESPEQKHMDILRKGQEMSRSDIFRLLEGEVQLNTINKYLRMDKANFAMMLKEYGFRKIDGYWVDTRKEPVDMALTKEKLEKYLNEGKSTKEIAQLEKTTIGSVYTAKSKFGLTKNKNAGAELEAVRKDIKIAIDENPKTVKKLQVLIERLEEEAAAFKAKEERLKSENAGLAETVEKLTEKIEMLKSSSDDTETEAHEAAEMIEQLKKENQELMNEVAKERERYDVYKRENDLLNETNADLRSMLSKQSRKAHIFGQALKEAII